jgi:hypothetical protein
LQRSLGHPALESLNAWYIAHVPVVKHNLSASGQNRLNGPEPPRSRPTEARHGARGRTRYAHAALQRPHPKPLVSVGGKALIDYVLDRLAEQGVERAVVNVHHLADQIERHLEQRERPTS